MPKIDFAVGSFLVGVVLALVLLALDKAEKLKGPWLLVLLAAAALLTVPLALSPSIVANAQGATKGFRILAALCVVGFIYAVLAAWISVPQTIASPPSVDATPPVVRVLYSSTQIIEISSAPPRLNETLNLDNVATMIQADEWSNDEIGMLLIDSPPLNVDKPVAGEPHNVDKGFTVAFQQGGPAGIKITGAMMSSGGTKYLFNRFTSPVHTVEVGKRHFKITLQSITDKSTKKKKHRAYTFGISEQYS